MQQLVIFQHGKKRQTPAKKSKARTYPDLVLTDRDQDIIKALHTYRVLETPQIQALIFSRSDNEYANKRACQRRLAQLHKAGYLWRGEQASKRLTEGIKPFIYRLDRRGVELLPELLSVYPGMIAYRPDRNDVSDLFLNHLLRTNDVRLAIDLASKTNGWTIQTWLDDKTLKSRQEKDYVVITGKRGRKQKVAIVPDGYFHLALPQKNKNYHSFLEVDLGTVTVQTSEWGRRSWARKVSAYIAYYSSGKYRRRYKTKRLRILTTTTTKQRLAYLKTITEQQKGKHLFWFTTLDEVKPETVLTEPIWQVATKENTREALIK